MTMLARLRPTLPAIGARDRRALRLGATVLLPALAFALVVRPYARALSTTYDELETQRALLARELGALRDAPRDAGRAGEARQALAVATQRLFDGADAVAASAELASYVSDQAVENGLEVEESETRAASPDDLPAMDIRARGDVLAIVDFLRALEDGPRLARVERIAIARDPRAAGEEWDGTLTLTATVTGLSLRAYATAPRDGAHAADSTDAAPGGTE